MKADMIKELRLMNTGLSHEAADRIAELERALHDCYDAVSWTGQGHVIGEIVSRVLGLTHLGDEDDNR